MGSLAKERSGGGEYTLSVFKDQLRALFLQFRLPMQSLKGNSRYRKRLMVGKAGLPATKTLA
jgi:hypothetical protein